MTTLCDILYRKYIISSDNILQPEWIDSTSVDSLFYHEYREENDIQFLLYSIFMSIYERLYELAIAKAIGTRPAFIGGLILLEAFALAVISCGIGLPIAFCLMTYFAANGLPLGGTMEFSGVVLPGRLYPELVWYQFVQFPLYVILLTVVAAIYPALFAARIAPARSLQKAL